MPQTLQNSQLFAFGIYVPSGIYNNKVWYTGTFNDSFSVYYTYIYWNSSLSRWEAVQNFTQSGGPSGFVYAYVSSNPSAPIGQWELVPGVDAAAGEFNPFSSDYSKNYDCPRYGCLTQVLNNAQVVQLALYSIGTYNNKKVYFTEGFTASQSPTVFTSLYIIWNSTANHWEAWSNFNGVIGSGTLYGILNNPSGSFPTNTSTIQWTQPNPTNYIDNTTEGICVDINPQGRYSFVNEPSGITLQNFATFNPPNPPSIIPGTWNYSVINFTIDGVQYSTNQTLTFTTPGDATLGFYLDGVTEYVTNIEDWMNSISVPHGVEFFNDKKVWQCGQNTTFNIVIRRVYGAQLDYHYTNNGFAITGPGNIPTSYAAPIFTLL